MHEQAATPARVQRHDGWTPERIRIFLHALANGKNVTAAAVAAGMSRQGAYAYRAAAGGRQFAAAWQSAQEHARRRRIDGVMDAIITKRLRRLQRLVGPGRRVVIEVPGASEGRGDPDAMQLWYR